MSEQAIVDERPSARRAWQGLLILLSFYMFAFIDRQIISLLVQPMKQELGLSDIQIGMLQGVAFALCFAVGGLAIGRLVDRRSRRWIIFWGMVVWSLSSAGCGIATGFGLLFLARLLVGVGEAALTPSAYSLLHDIFPRERLATAMAIFSSGATIGAGLAFAAGGALIGMLPADGVVAPFWGEMSTWRVAFLLTGLPGVLLAFLVFAVPEPRRRHKTEKIEGGPEKLTQFFMRQRLLLTTFFLAFPTLAICPVTLMAWGPTFLIRHHGWEAQEVGMAFGVIAGIFGTTGNLLSGIVVDFAYRHGMRDAHFRIPMTTAVIALPVVAAGLLTDSAALSIGMLGLAFALFTMYAGPAASALQIVAPNHLRGQISAIFIVLISIVGTGVGPVAVGFVTDALLRDEAQLGVSMIIVFALAAATAATLMAAALPDLRAAMGVGDARTDEARAPVLVGGEEGARI